jgi:hypothetical protein
MPISPQPRKTRRCPQLPRKGTLAVRPVERAPEVFFGCSGTTIGTIQGNEFALDAQQLG